MISGMKNSFYISFGIWMAILPHLGIPSVWKTGLMTASGLFLVLTAVGPFILEKLRMDTKEVVREAIKKRNYARKPKIIAPNKSEPIEEIKEIPKEETEEKQENDGREEKREKVRRKTLESKVALHEIETP